MIEFVRTVDGGRRVTMRFTEAADGDFAIAAEGVDRRRSATDDRTWSWCRQVHGNTVVTVDHPRCGDEADALISSTNGRVLTVQTADCVPVLLWSPQGHVGAAHAGWKGACAEVVEATVAALQAHGATSVHAVIGPHIHAASYEFDPSDAAPLVALHGEDVISETSWGTPALDMTAVTISAIRSAGAILDHDVDQCTSSDRWWSHRIRTDEARLAACVVLD